MQKNRLIFLITFFSSVSGIIDLVVFQKGSVGHYPDDWIVFRGQSGE